MLYLGHFSFDENNHEARFGHFTAVVEAKNPKAAEKAFKKLIQDMRKKKSLFTNPVDIFLDSFTEMGAVPQSGIISCYTSYSGEKEGSISTYLPHEDNGGCQGYFFYPSDRPDIAEKMDAMEQHDSLPFISFEPTAVQRRAAEIREEFERMKARQAVPERRNSFTRKPRW